jgi:hypothetical protein
MVETILRLPTCPNQASSCPARAERSAYSVELVYLRRSRRARKQISSPIDQR